MNVNAGRLLLTTLLALLPLEVCSAGGSKSLGLEECIEMALQQNQTVLSASQGVESAKGAVVEARAAMLPVLGMQATYRGWEKLTTMDLTKDYQVSFSLSQPLFTGGRVWQAYKQARLSLQIAEEQYRQARQEVRYDVKQSFYGYLLAEQLAAVAQEGVALAQSHLELVKTKYQEGEASQFEVLRAEVELENLKPQHIRAQNSLHVAELELKSLLGFDLGVWVAFEGEFVHEPYEANLDECVDLALRNRPEVVQSKYQEELALSAVRWAQAGHMPTATIGFSYDLAANKPKLEGEEWEDNYSGHIALAVPIFGGGATRGRIRQARGRLGQAKLAGEQLADAVRLEVTQAFLDLQEAGQIIASASKGRQQAQEGLSIAEESYAAGVVTHLEVMDARLALTQSKTNYSQALHDYVLAQARLEKAMGR